MKLSLAFGTILKRIRKSRGFTQGELAEKTGLDRTFISLLERGERQPSLATIFVISKKLKIHPSQLIGQVERLAVRKAKQKIALRRLDFRL